MSVSAGYGLTSLSNTVALNLGTVQARLQSSVTHLSSGLRINTAADDPSGLAIAEGLQSRVSGYTQAVSNVRDATNALTVADGALQTITDILQRLRTLAVEANNGVLSDGDRANLQTEADQLRHEIDAISTNTTFNGVSLLSGSNSYVSGLVAVTDGTFATPAVGVGATSYTYTPTGTAWTTSAAGATAGAGVTAVDASNPFTKYNVATQPPSGSSQVGFVQGTGTLSQNITGFSAYRSYYVTFNVERRAAEYPNGDSAPQGFDVLIGGTAIASYLPTAVDPYHPTWTSITTPVFSPGNGTFSLAFRGSTPSTNMTFLDDVSIHVQTGGTTLLPAGNTLDIQSGAAEGDTVAAALPSTGTSYLGVSSMSFLTLASSSTAETSLDSALTTVGSARANMGAEMVRLQEQSANDSTSIVELTGSESAIRDVNVSAATIGYTRDQILVSAGTSILANVKTLAASVETLFG